MTERVEILGVQVDAVTMAQAVERVINLIGEKNPRADFGNAIGRGAD